jgi:aminoglycoside phosphotransferase (APT) family kinase protein
VIRFDALDDEDQADRYQTEKLAYTLLGGIVPVPEVIALDESRSLAPVNYLITTKCPGRQMIERWQDLTGAQRQRAAFQAGVCLAQMHNQTLFRRCGAPHKVVEGKGFVVWYDYMKDFADRYMREARELQALDEPMMKRIDRTVTGLKPIMETVTQAVLLHSDYHFENVLQSDGMVTGIIDFEWAITGDPAWDFRVEDKWEEMCPGSREIIYAGYQSRRTLPDHLQHRAALYKLLMWLDNVVLNAFRGNSTEYQESLTVMTRYLIWLEQNELGSTTTGDRCTS